MSGDLFVLPIARTFGKLIRESEADPVQAYRAVLEAHAMMGRGNFFDRHRREILEGLFDCDLRPSMARAHLVHLPDGRAWTVLDDLRAWKAATGKSAKDTGKSIEGLLSHVRATRPGGLVGGPEFVSLLGLAVLAANEGGGE